MSGIDASIIGKLETPKIDPLATMGKLQGVQKGVLENRLLGQEVQGKETLGRIIGEATDASGKTDWDKVSAAASKDPRAAILLPEIQKAAIDRQISQSGLSKAELEVSAQRWGKVGDFSTALLAEKQPLTKDAVIKLMKIQLVDSGMFQDPKSAELLVNFATNLPEDDAGIRAMLKGIGLQSNTTSDRINAIIGAPTTVDRGPEILVKQTSPLTGETTTAAVIPKGRTPSEVATLVDVYDPVTKQMVKKPSGEIVGDMPANMRPQTVAAGPALGVAEAETAAASKSVEQAQELRVMADAVPTQQAALKNIRDTVEAFKPGAKTNWIYAAQALATQLGVAPKQMQDEVAAQEEFNKLATQFINQQMGALGGSGTDSKLESAAKGSPNEFMSREGIQNVTSLMMGLNDAVLAKNAAWQKWLDAGNSPGSYGKFQTQFNAIYNPRVFQSVYMSDKQKQLMMGNMTEKERKDFQRDWTRAKAAGWIQ